MRASSAASTSSSRPASAAYSSSTRRGEGLDPELVDEDLDPRLVLVVAPAFEIVDPEDRLQIGEQFGPGQEVADDLADHRRPPEPAADHHPIADLAGLVADDAEADIVDADRRPVLGRAGHRDLELARQPAELGVQARPLADQLGGRARVLDLVGGDAGEMVGGDVADAIARGLDAVHLDVGEQIENVGDVLQPRPVELDVLPRGEMAVAAVVAVGDQGELAQLARAQRAIGNGDAQHVGVKLEVEAVHLAG